MILNIHSDVSYLLEMGIWSRAVCYFFLGWRPKHGKPIRLNGALLVLSSILKCVAESSAEAELRALFVNLKEVCVLRLALE